MIGAEQIQVLNDMASEDLRDLMAHAAGIHAHRDGDGGVKMPRSPTPHSRPADVPASEGGMTGAPAWCDDRTQKLGELIDRGASAGQAARALHIGRGAVTGRVYRLGWRLGVPRTEDQRKPPFLCVRHTKRERPKKAPRDPAEAMKSVNCAFDRETFAVIVRRADAEGVSRPQIIRELVEWGLEAVAQERGQ